MTDTSTDKSWPAAEHRRTEPPAEWVDDPAARTDPAGVPLPPLPPKWSAPLTEQHEAGQPSYAHEREQVEAAEVEAADDREAKRTGGTFASKYLPVQPDQIDLGEAVRAHPLVRARQAAIDAAETARVNALLQVCRWVPDGSNEVNIWDTEDGPCEIVQLLGGIQHDLIQSADDQLQAYESALGVLALRWHHLPVDARQVVLAGLVPVSRLTEWDQVRAASINASSSRAYDLRVNFARSVLGL